MSKYCVYLDGSFTVEQEVEAVDETLAVQKAANAVEVHFAEEGVLLHVSGVIVRKIDSVEG